MKAQQGARWAGVIGLLLGIGAPGASAGVIDVIDSSNGGVGTYFVPSDGQKFDDPYYRWYNQDWGWTHNPIAGSFTSATLSISAWDVDAALGEVDKIYVYLSVGGPTVLLGSLAGGDNIWSYTSFDVTAYAAQINAGLRVWMNIDSTHSYDYWAVTLAKSVLSTDGASLPSPSPNPNPTRVPDAGSTSLLLVAAIGALGFVKKRVSS